MAKSLRNTKLSNATNAHSCGDWITSDIKKAMTSKTTSFGFVVIADD
jgi:hypothetical protein